MKRKKLGIIALVIGIIMIGYSGFNYIKSEKTLKGEVIKIDKAKGHNMQWPPTIGLIVLSLGILILVREKKVIS